ncbi:chloride channel protein [Raineyella sp.]|uniref:chloride channel protein n=1 Tax=Raineyella sp. TaxID=1911550 RepID=UPI002B1FD4D6|nr:chloride channel protein [Raineyella sp.]MEA5155532.1 chloride channel protein [Raineyella sp.]
MTAAVVLGGLAAGLVGAGMTLLLRGIEIVAYGQDGTSLAQGAAPLRRILAPVIGGTLAGLGWWVLRRNSEVLPLSAALEDPDRPVRFWRTTTDALLQVLLVGAGGSLGREGAPRQTAAVAAQLIGRRLGVAPDDGRIILAAAAGAGLAAVYNVPLAGALFALEILLARRSPRAVVTALTMSVIATLVARPVVADRPTYDFPMAAPDAGTLGWAVVAVPLCALLGLSFHALRVVAERHRPPVSWRLPVAIAVAGLVLGLLSVPLPDLPGNGAAIMQTTFAGGGSVTLFALLVLLKPLVTGLYVRSGAVGGLLTPALATGAAAGGLAATIVRATGGEASVALWSLVGSAGVLAVTQRAPLFASAMAFELTGAPLWTAPVLVAVAYAATGTAHLAVRVRARRRARRPPVTRGR